ncbi:hypothetical protein ACH5RR_029084 [Cinchona calisaya]|uniref:Uncharacterized protein n=1 Tax=Cinchona calisaya TaxID=153742 RepID=A0ABD2YQQ3_9GENT
MHSSLVKYGLIRSVEFPSNESCSQHGPTTFGSLDYLESFMSSLPSTKDIYNLFDNGVFFKGSGFLQIKRTKKAKRFSSCGIHDEPRPSTPLGDLSPTNENSVRGIEVVSKIVDKISSKGENQSLAYEARLKVTCSQLESINEEYGKLVQDDSSMNNSLNVLDGEINKFEMSLSLLQTHRAAKAQTLSKHESTLINTSRKLLALKIEYNDLKSSADHAFAKEKVHSVDLEKLNKAVKALKNQLLL